MAIHMIEKQAVLRRVIRTEKCGYSRRKRGVVGRGLVTGLTVLMLIGGAADAYLRGGEGMRRMFQIVDSVGGWFAGNKARDATLLSQCKAAHDEAAATRRQVESIRKEFRSANRVCRRKTARKLRTSQ